MRRAEGAGGARPKRPKGGSGALQPPGPGRSRSKALTRDRQAASASPDLAPDIFPMRVRLEETGEVFRVANCRSDMTVRELREELDLLAGVPLNLQRLQYLDQGVLMDDATLKFYDVIPGGLLSLCTWHYDGWTELVLAAVEGDPNKLSCLGISEDSSYRTANAQHFQGEEWKQWTSRRAFVALYITAHRGHSEAVQCLLEHGTETSASVAAELLGIVGVGVGVLSIPQRRCVLGRWHPPMDRQTMQKQLTAGANCFGKTPVGRTALHAAAAMGRMECINLLLERGASIHEKDAKGESPMAVARRLNRKQSERRMFLFYWLSRSGKKDPSELIRKEVLQGADSRLRPKTKPMC